MRDGTWHILYDITDTSVIIDWHWCQACLTRGVTHKYLVFVGYRSRKSASFTDSCFAYPTNTRYLQVKIYLSWYSDTGVIASCRGRTLTLVSNCHDTSVIMCVCTPRWPPGIGIYMLETGLYRPRSDIYMSGGAYICKIFARAARSARSTFTLFTLYTL